MTIRIGERLPEGRLWEFLYEEQPGCSIGPNAVEIGPALAGRRIVIFGLPGAYTPTCSAKHVPGYVERRAELAAKGVDEVWCVSVNDAFVMGAWGRELGSAGKLRMMGDGNGDWTRALDLGQDMSARGLGFRSQRYAMLVEDGVVRALRVEAPGRFEVSDAGSMLALL